MSARRSYTAFMLKDAAANGSRDFRDRSVAVVVSGMLHLLAFAWLWLTSAVVGGRGSEAPGYSSGSGTSAYFLAPDEFRQRIDIQLPSVTPETTVSFEKPLESVQGIESVSTESYVDVVDTADSEILDKSALAEIAISMESGAAANHTGPASDHGAEDSGHSKDQGLRAAYLVALRVAIREHWQYDGHRGSCRLTLQQSQGGRLLNLGGTSLRRKWKSQ